MLLAQDAIHIERALLGSTFGNQDQVAFADGGLNRIDCGRDYSITVTPVYVGKAERGGLESSMMLFCSGMSRIAAWVLLFALHCLLYREMLSREEGGRVPGRGLG